MITEKRESAFGNFLRRKDIVISFKRYAVEAMGNMALGLFASLLIGTILSTVAEATGYTWFEEVAGYAKAAAGPAMAVAIGMALKAPPLALLSLCGVGAAANALGGPLGTLLATIIAAELGKAVSKETRIDILVTPAVTLLSGYAVSSLAGPAISALMTGFGSLIMSATVLEPFWMGIIVAVLMGIILTLPISSAAICATLGLVGLAGGAATVGCCTHMVGFAVMSFAENGWGGLAAQGLGTSMLQMGNLMRNPRCWIPPILASAVAGPIATCVFGMENGNAVASGMGTCGLVGPIGVISAAGFGGAQDWLGLLLCCIVLPAVLTPIFAWPLRKLGWIKKGDLALEL